MNTLSQYKITREEQDRFALESHRKAKRAIEEGRFKDQIVPVKLKDDVFEVDETVRFDTSLKNFQD